MFNYSVFRLKLSHNGEASSPYDNIAGVFAGQIRHNALAIFNRAAPWFAIKPWGIKKAAQIFDRSPFVRGKSFYERIFRESARGVDPRQFSQNKHLLGVEKRSEVRDIRERR